MRISEHFHLGYSQHEFDFIDVDTSVDTPLFLDPFFLAHRRDPWSVDAHRTLTHYFRTILHLVSSGKRIRAELLLSYLGEPNETCLGLSRGRPQGRGVGGVEAGQIVDHILSSRAIETGLVEDLQDLRVLVKGIGPDKISDITTNVIRKHLVEYTAAQAELWGMPMQKDVPTGFFWDSAQRSWRQEYAGRLVIEGRPILLVPKGVVSFAKDYTPYQYHQHFVLNFLRDEHLNSKYSPFVHVNKTKKGKVTRRVYKRELKEEVAPLEADFLVDFTLGHPEVFADFKSEAGASAGKSLDVDEIERASLLVREPGATYNGGDRRIAVANHLIEKLKDTPPGNDAADEYHRIVAAALEFCLYPRLTCPQVEAKIHSGRKRIDITFDNSAELGVFYNLHEIHGFPCRYILVECKNYSTDPKNPELDQLTGRFGPNRGQFGILVIRGVGDRDTLIERCRDAHRDNRGLPIFLDDEDLIAMIHEARRGEPNPGEKLLQDRVREVSLA